MHIASEKLITYDFPFIIIQLKKFSDFRSFGEEIWFNRLFKAAQVCFMDMVYLQSQQSLIILKADLSRTRIIQLSFGANWPSGVRIKDFFKRIKDFLKSLQQKVTTKAHMTLGVKKS